MLRNSSRAMPLAGSNLPHSVVEECIIRMVFSLGRSHVSDRGERSREARSSRKKRSREPSAVLRECERPNVGDVYSPWGDVTIVTEGNEAGRPELAQKEVEGGFCCSESVRATKRRRRIFSLGRCHEVTEGYEDSRSPGARTERGRGNSHGLFLCERRDSNPYARRHQILSLAWLPITTRSQNPSEDS